MTVTRSFRETVQARATNDPHYRYGLLTESMNAMLSGDLETGKSLLRDYINATIGFEGLSDALGKSPKSLMCPFKRKPVKLTESRIGQKREVFSTKEDNSSRALSCALLCGF